MRFSIHQESRIGQRAENEDRACYCYSRESLCMVVADGMGGHLHGEVAAQIAVQFVIEAFQRQARPMLDDPMTFLPWALNNAHRAILDYCRQRGLKDSPRTTCVCCIVQGGEACWAHAGDSRLYLLRGSSVLARTRDHSRVQMLIDQGDITENEAAGHPLRNRIFSCLGSQQDPQIDLSPRIRLAPGDVLALCTDGAWVPLHGKALIYGLPGTDLPRAVPHLLDQAEAVAGKRCDNLSMIAMTWEEAPAEHQPRSIETVLMSPDEQTTLMEEFSQEARPRLPELTEEEIERAIAEIRSSIQRFSN